MKVYVLTSHRGWGEDTNVDGLFSSVAAAKAEADKRAGEPVRWTPFHGERFVGFQYDDGDRRTYFPQIEPFEVDA